MPPTFRIKSSVQKINFFFFKFSHIFIYFFSGTRLRHYRIGSEERRVSILNEPSSGTSPPRKDSSKSSNSSLSSRGSSINLDKMDAKSVANKLKYLEQALKENELKLLNERKAREDQEKRLQEQLEKSKKVQEEQKRLKKVMFENELKLKQELEARQQMLDWEKREREKTKNLLRMKEEELSDVIAR